MEGMTAGMSVIVQKAEWKEEMGGRKHWVFRAGGPIRNPEAELWLGGQNPGRQCGGSSWGGPWSVSLRFLMVMSFSFIVSFVFPS